MLFSLVTDMACALGSPFRLQVQRLGERERFCGGVFAPFSCIVQHLRACCAVCVLLSVILEAEERKTHMLRMFLSFIHWLLLSL